GGDERGVDEGEIRRHRVHHVMRREAQLLAVLDEQALERVLHLVVRAARTPRLLERVHDHHDARASKVLLAVALDRLGAEAPDLLEQRAEVEVELVAQLIEERLVGAELVSEANAYAK